MTDTPTVDPLILEAVKRASVAWIDASGVEYALWCLWSDGALLVVCGEGEQNDPGFTPQGTCRVRMRGDHGGRIVGFGATVHPIKPGTPQWDELVPSLASKRLNSSGGDTAAQWAAKNTVWRLVPDAVPDQAGTALPATSLAAEPRPNSATRPARRPYRLHRVKKRSLRPWWPLVSGLESSPRRRRR